MRVLQLHNQYAKRGGEDTVVEQERSLLQSHGHEVHAVIEKNVSSGATEKLRDAIQLRRNRAFLRKLNHVIQEFRPDICHVHNVFWRMSPAVYPALQRHDVPVVQTLHNYRLFCVNSYFYRQGRICEDCLNINRQQALRHRCYDGSVLKTFFMSDAVGYHWKEGTWTSDIDAFICLSEFAKRKFITGGLPCEKLKIKSNFIKLDPYPSSDDGYFLFVGRFSKEKGAEELLQAANLLPEVSFKVIGEVANGLHDSSIENIEWVGPLSHARVMQFLAKCRAVLFLSEMYEGMPMGIIEAFALTKPVIARNRGAMQSMISHQFNGLLFEEFQSLIECIRQLDYDPAWAQELGVNAYTRYQESYTPDKNYEVLMDIYQTTIHEKRSRKN